MDERIELSFRDAATVLGVLAAVVGLAGILACATPGPLPPPPPVPDISGPPSLMARADGGVQG